MHLLYAVNDAHYCVRRREELIIVCLHVDKLRGTVLWTGMCNGNIKSIRYWKGYRRLNATNAREERHA